MKCLVNAFVMLTVVLPDTGAAVTTPRSVEVTRNIASMPLAFTANQGQWDQQVMFRTDAGGATMWFTSSGATYRFTRTIGTKINAPYSILDRRYGMNTGGRQTSSSSPNTTRTGAPQLAVERCSDSREYSISSPNRSPLPTAAIIRWARWFTHRYALGTPHRARRLSSISIP